MGKASALGRHRHVKKNKKYCTFLHRIFKIDHLERLYDCSLSVNTLHLLISGTELDPFKIIGQKAVSVEYTWPLLI